MSAYVVYGQRWACVIRGGFACTRDELPVELQRVAGPAIGQIVAYESCGSEDDAQVLAKHYNGGPAGTVIGSANHR